mmetsp:Transcript_7667/g.20751  ORF Transcript_7667/g.20751 Transcript_7667/m.20751 type:complete len:345 (+) Transcript_7667:775-1809(+)
MPFPQRPAYCYCSTAFVCSTSALLRPVHTELLSHLLGVLGECIEHEVVSQGCHECALLGIGSATMPSLDVLVIVHRPLLPFAKIPQLLHHLPSMGGMNAIILRGCREQDRGIRFSVDIDVVIRRVLVKEVVPVISVWVAVLGHPAGSSQQGVEALHIQQRNGAMDRTEQLRRHGVHVAHEQAAIGSSPRCERLRRADLRFDQMLRNSNEVFVALVPVLFQACLMPGWSEFSATTDVGFDVHAAAFKPGKAGGCDVVWSKRDLESAVPIQQGGILSIQLNVLFHDDEVRYLSPVLARGHALLHFQPGGVVHFWKRPELVRDKEVIIIVTILGAGCLVSFHFRGIG